MTPASQRSVVQDLKTQHHLSERRSCQLVGISRSSYHYQAHPREDAEIRSRLCELASRYPRYGYLLLWRLLRAEGLVVNKKRVYRIYKEERLQVPKRKRNKLIRTRQRQALPAQVNERWSMDFVSDRLSNGRAFRILNVMDDCSRELIGQYIGFSIGSRQVISLLEQLIAERCRPQGIVCDNGPEFTSKKMHFWSQDSGVERHFIQPGKPTQNAFVESLNGKFRENCLSQHLFRSLEQACHIIEQWRYHYNHERPHSSLDYMTPAAYAARVA